MSSHQPPHSPGASTVVNNRSTLRKFSANGIKSQTPCFRVLLLGLPGVGKTAFAVRFVTGRFIGDYDSSSERMYQERVYVNDEWVNFFILDTINHESKSDGDLKEQILWADAFILIYSVTDQCSFREVDRLKFLINYTKKNKHRDKSHLSDTTSTGNNLVFLVGNKQDIFGERMVSTDEGQVRCHSSGCAAFFETTVRESVSSPRQICLDLYTEWAYFHKKKPHKPATSRGLLSVDSSSGNGLWKSLQSKPRTLSDDKSQPPSPNLSVRDTGETSPRSNRTSPLTIHRMSTVTKYLSSIGSPRQEFSTTPVRANGSEVEDSVFLFVTPASDVDE